MKQHLMNPPNWFTLGSLLCSFSAILRITSEPITHELNTACFLILVAGALDMADGWVARCMGCVSVVGSQLDSFADLVGFGVAPALVLWVWGFNSYEILGAIVISIYVLASALRLARFNAESLVSGRRSKGRVQGLTTTISGVTLVSGVWASEFYSDFESDHIGLVMVMVVTIALLQISELPYRDFRDARKSWFSLSFLICLALFVLIVGGFCIVYSICFFGVLYIFLGAIEAMIYSERQLN